MTILVIDGQGGGIGCRLITGLLPHLQGRHTLLCVGTNSLATAAMLKAGAQRGATGENAAIHNAGGVDLILGPIGILLANGIMGEISPAMAMAISGSRGHKIVIPSAGCGCQVAGGQSFKLEELLQQGLALAKVHLESS